MSNMRPRPTRYVLVTDGSSDACLTFPIGWLLRSLGWPQLDGEWADLRVLSQPAPTLLDRVRLALEHYPADLIFIHRDAKKQPRDDRVDEITAAVAALGRPITHVCVIPVRMTESWLLHDEAAIRRAAGNPNGTCALEIPAVKRLDTLTDPKTVLKQALLTASEATGRLRKRKARDFGVMRHRVAELIDDYAPLRDLSAFQSLEDELRQLLAAFDA
jgi:hypothetical protein